MQELFTMVRQEILKSGYYNLLPAGIVLSGGGSQLAGSAELCRQVTGMPTRLGATRSTVGVSEDLRSPVYATAVGLVQYGARHHRQLRQVAQDDSLLGRITRWFKQHMAHALGT